MTETVPDILARIVERKRAELHDASASIASLRKQAEPAVRRDFTAALRARRPAIIAEIKKASPSRGVLAPDFHPARTAVQYETGGAAALSVLTDRDFFHGSLADLNHARSAVRIPVLRKDFTVSEYHVHQAAAHGADAILLIAAILDREQLRGFRELAASYSMAALVEVHDERELEKALASAPEIVGVNNRDLRTFDVRMETSLNLVQQIPANVLKVSESGIHTAAQVQELTCAGFDAFLVGESLMISPDPSQALRSLCS